MKYIVIDRLLVGIRDTLTVAESKVLAIALGAVALTACASGLSPTQALPFYRCEYGIEFTAKFSGDSVVLDSTRGYDVLYRSGKSVNPVVSAQSKTEPQAYSNPRMGAEFHLGVLQRDAILRYPLLPLTSRCVRDN